MTQKANPSINRPAEAFKTAGAIAYGGSDEGFISPANSPTEISVQDGGINEGQLNAFDETSSGSSLDVTIDGGEAFVFGSWLAIDSSTTVSLDADTDGQTVSVGWNKNGSDDVIVGLDAAFSSATGDADQKIPLFSFDTDGSGVTNVVDERSFDQISADSIEQGSGSGLDADTVDGVEATELGSDVSNNGTTVTSSSTDLDFGENLVAADDGDGTSSISLDLTRFIGEDELPADETLQILSDEYMVVGGSYTLNGDAQIDGDLVTVANQTSHDTLVSVDPTDHLEVITEYEITANTGSTPAFDGTLINAFTEETTAFDVTVAPTSGLNDTYAFNFDDGKRYNNGSWDVPLTVNWDEDPGQDLDLTVRIHKRT